MTSVTGFSKCMLLFAYAFGLSAVAKMVSAYADSVGRDTEVPPIMIACMIQIFVCATGILIWAWFGVDKSVCRFKEEQQKYTKRQVITLTITLALSLALWIGYLY